MLHQLESEFDSVQLRTVGEFRPIEAKRRRQTNGGHEARPSTSGVLHCTNFWQIRTNLTILVPVYPHVEDAKSADESSVRQEIIRA